MGHSRPKRRHPTTKSHTLPSSPTYSSSSSDFEFTISASQMKSSDAATAPADELFYKGQLLPLHPSTRLSMVRTILLSSASTSSSSDTATTASRDSTASHSSTDDSLSSGRPSSFTDDVEFKRLTSKFSKPRPKPTSKYFTLPKLFRKEHIPPPSGGSGTAKRVSSSAKDMICRYLKKVKPLYDKFSHKHKISTPTPAKPPPSRIFRSAKNTLCVAIDRKYQESNYRNKENGHASTVLQSFSGNLRLYPSGRSYIASCPSSMGSSPSHVKSGLGHGSGFSQAGRIGMYNPDASSMEELQNAIQGAIAHCKNSML